MMQTMNDPLPTNADTLLTTGQVALHAGVSPATVRLWADEGLIPCVRTAGRCGQRLFQKSDVTALIAVRQEQRSNAA